jgi:micrococcal nuclease
MIKRILIIVVCAALVIGTLLYLRFFPSQSDETYEVSQIIDGDTIKLSNGERVRLIGINTPETGQPYYTEATEKLTDLIGNNSVTLEKDTQDKDQYERLLRYVYVGGTHVNLEMVREGYAIAYYFPPNTKYSDDFEDAEQEARTSQLGIWLPSEFNLSVIQIHFDADGDDSLNLNDEYVIFENDGTAPIDMTDWMTLDEANNLYIFPTFVLGNGSTITLYTGQGIDNSTEVYWGNDNPIWNNDGDSLFLRDAEGYLVTYSSY